MSEKEKKLYHPEIIPEECKGCGKCIYSCPRKILSISDKINKYGFKYAICVSEGCIGCGNCFYACPEPGAITVYRITNGKKN